MSLLDDLRKTAERNLQVGLRPSGAASIPNSSEARKVNLLNMLVQFMPMPSATLGLGPTLGTPLGVIEKLITSQLLRGPTLRAAGKAGYEEGYDIAQANPFLTPGR